MKVDDSNQYLSVTEGLPLASTKCGGGDGDSGNNNDGSDEGMPLDEAIEAMEETGSDFGEVAEAYDSFSQDSQDPDAGWEDPGSDGIEPDSYDQGTESPYSTPSPY